jgi:hypothetical protein
LWVGGDGGMAVYDGVSFKSIGPADGLPVPLVWSIIESRLSPGTLYAGTHGGGVSKIRRISRRLNSTCSWKRCG